MTNADTERGTRRQADRQASADVTPDSLLTQFKGKGLKPIVMFTVIAHVVIILGSSVPFLVGHMLGPDNEDLAEEERVKNAVEDATVALRKIAKKHGLNPQDISDQFSGAAPRSTKVPAAGASSPSSPEADDRDDNGGSAPEREKSAYETNLKTAAEGPTMPTFEQEQDDIF